LAFPPVGSGPRDAVLLRYLPGLSLTAAKVDDRLFLFFFAQLCRGLVYPSGAKKRSIFDALVESLAKRVSVRVSEGPNGFLQVAAMSQIVVDSRSFWASLYFEGCRSRRYPACTAPVASNSATHRRR